MENSFPTDPSLSLQASGLFCILACFVTLGMSWAIDLTKVFAFTQYDSNKDTFFLQIEAFEAQCLFLAMTFASLLISFLLCVFGLGKSEMRKSAENKCKAVLGDQETELNVIGERGQANDSREQGPL